MAIDFASRFPVIVRVARNEADRRRIHALRARVEAADGAEVDPADLRENATLLIAESPIDGETLGSVRILTSERGRLLVEDRFELPASLRNQSLAEGSRLVVGETGQPRLVRLMLWKAFHRYCLAAQIDTMLIVAREPADQEYEWLGFTDALPGARRFALSAQRAPTCRLMRLGVFEARDRMQRSGHPLHDFFFVERHPEIDLVSPVPSSRTDSRAARAPKLPDHTRIAAELAAVAIV